MAGNEAPQFNQHTCCGVVEEATYRARQRREQKQKQPWVVRKLAVGITIGISAYATYVYIGRFCVPMIRSDSGALGNRAMGIGFLVVFCILALMTYWSYLKVILTPPGFARDHVSKSPEPHPSTMARFNDSWVEGAGGWQYEGTTYPTDDPSQEGQARGLSSEGNGSTVLEATEKQHRSLEDSDSRLVRNVQDDPDTGDLDAIPPVAAARAANDPSLDASASAQAPQAPPRTGVKSESGRGATSPRRRPPTTPILLPEYRYCYKDGFIKPLRAHHCRSCGTCVLRFDHHCPWIGQCVGARNHKFFFIFCQWAALCWTWVFATLLAQNVKAGNSSNLDISIDPQQIAIIALAGLFMIFTLTMIASHTRLIISNQTTVEHLGVQRLKEREGAILGNSFAWYQISAKRQIRKQWDEEWGELGKEGNLWWLGSHRANWESVMGSSVLGWFLPIGRSPLSGLKYRTNPRFDEQGRWRPRKEWPDGLK